PADRLEVLDVVGGGHDDDALHPVLLEQAQVALLAPGVVVGRGDHERVVVPVEALLDAARDIGEERVGDVAHDGADGRDGAGPQLPGGAVAHEVELRDGGLDPLPGAGKHPVGPVEDVRHRADGDTGCSGDVGDGCSAMSSRSGHGAPPCFGLHYEPFHDGLGRGGPNMSTTSGARVCFTSRVRADRLDEYRAAHAAVWPEMLRALRDTGWRDYHLYLRDDGLLVGILVTDDYAAAQERMAATEVNARWQEAMSGL